MSTYFLGVGGTVHDASAALVRDGEIIAAAEEERFTRVKHMGGIPHNAIRYCLREGSISLADCQAVGFYRNEGLAWRRAMAYYLSTVGRDSPFHVAKQVASNTVETLRSYRALKRALPSTRIVPVNHHTCHMATAYYSSPFNEAALLVTDALGERICTVLGRGEGNRISWLKAIPWPHSLGFLYGSVTDYLGFDFGDAEYKVMGLSAYGKPTFYEDMRKIVRLLPEGEYKLDLSYFSFHLGRGLVSDKFTRVFGPPRSPDEPVTERHADIAASLQKVFEEIVFHLAEDLHKRTGLDTCCLSGGVAQNSVANGRLAHQSHFSNIYVPPAPGDMGSSIGAALHLWYLSHPEAKRNAQVQHSFYGPGFSDKEIEEALNLYKLPYTKPGDIAKSCAQLLAQGKIVGWFQGRMEMGPRALGNRSILADPRRPEMKDMVNQSIKFREEFRPFAPSLPTEEANRFFECASPSPFMSFVYKVKEEQQKTIPAVVHVDGTGRLQTLEERANPLFYRVIREFGRLTGVPVVLNTSFNVKGEPIVCTPQDAIRCFYSCGLDALILGPYLIDKRGPGEDPQNPN